jgi:hypothetical protein
VVGEAPGDCLRSIADDVLQVLDACCDAYTFPMLDNGYTYLAATRLSLHRSPDDWALVIETFGFSPRAGLPATHIQTYASRLHNRDSAAEYASQAAYQNYLAHHPHNEFRAVSPVLGGDWLDPEWSEQVAEQATEVDVRGCPFSVPAAPEYARHGITLEQPPRVFVFELCRYLAAVARDDVLATESERRLSVRPEMQQILQLEEWQHPNVVDESERPSGSSTFQMLARVLETGDVGCYQPTAPPNTHWSHWPDGGTL